MKQEKPREELTFKEKIENFWYYYKVPVIAVIIVAFIAAFFINERRHTVVSDLKTTLATVSAVTDSSIDFNKALPGLVEDINGDGEANITISRLYISENLSEENDETYLNTLESQLSGKGSTLFIFDKANLDRMIKKDAFCSLDEFFDISAYGDRVVYRNGEPVALHLTGSRVLADMEFNTDDLYVMLLFRRPGDEENAECTAEYRNAVLMIEELMKQ